MLVRVWQGGVKAGTWRGSAAADAMYLRSQRYACFYLVTSSVLNASGDLMVSCCNNSKYLEDLTG